MYQAVARQSVKLRQTAIVLSRLELAAEAEPDDALARPEVRVGGSPVVRAVVVLEVFKIRNGIVIPHLRLRSSLLSASRNLLPSFAHFWWVSGRTWRTVSTSFSRWS
jgi:hypothetical protein